MDRRCLLYLFFLIMVLPGCGKKEVDVLEIGSILPLTGNTAKYGENTRRGIEIAVKEINDNGGIKGKKLEVKYEDDQADPKLTVNAFQKMVSLDGIRFFIGPLTSSSVLAVAPIANQNRALILAPAASAPQITNAGDYVFRNVMSDVYDGEAVAEYAYQNLGLRSAGVIYINNDFGVGLYSSFDSAFSRLGGRVLAAESYAEQSTDYRTQLIKIRRYSPQFVFLVGQSQMGYILKQSTEIGYKSRWLSFTMFENPEIVKAAGKAAEGVEYTFRSFDPASTDSLVRRFAAVYKQKYGTEFDIFAGLAYDAARIMANAILIGGDDVERAKNALYNTKNFPGVIGNTTFDKNGDVVQPIGIKTVKDGKFVWVLRSLSRN